MRRVARKKKSRDNDKLGDEVATRRIATDVVKQEKEKKSEVVTVRNRNGRRATEWENEWWMRRAKNEESQLCAGWHVGG